jgi:UDP-glucose:(heptosyl)LPS alpha-1,3-glucosyltransferase
LKERRYRRLIALTPRVKDDLVRLYGTPAEDIAVIPNGYARNEFCLERRAQKREPMRAQLGYQESNRVIIFVANELERKGFFPLLRAIARLDDPNIRLLAVGELDASSCQREIERLRMDGRVIFTGPTDNAADYYAAADLFALPTKYEAWGLVIVEALASGLPVLTSRLAGAAVAVREGVTGLLLDAPEDDHEIAGKLRCLLGTSIAPESTIAASVEAYAWDRLLVEYEAILAASSN